MKKNNMIKMTPKQFFKEHIPLVKTLESGSKSKQLEEAKDQIKEMKKEEKKMKGEKKEKLSDKLNKLIGGEKETKEKEEKEEK